MQLRSASIVNLTHDSQQRSLSFYFNAVHNVRASADGPTADAAARLLRRRKNVLRSASCATHIYHTLLHENETADDAKRTQHSGDAPPLQAYCIDTRTNTLLVLRYIKHCCNMHAHAKSKKRSEMYHIVYIDYVLSGKSERRARVRRQGKGRARSRCIMS